MRRSRNQSQGDRERRALPVEDSQPLYRREFLRHGLLLGGGLVLVACGDNPSAVVDAGAGDRALAGDGGSGVDQVRPESGSGDLGTGHELGGSGDGPRLDSISHADGSSGGCVPTGGGGTPNIKLGMTFSQIKSIIESTAQNGVVNIEKGVYTLATNSNTAEIKIPAGVTINGNCAEFRVYGSTRDAALTNNTQRLYLRLYNSNIKVNSLVLRGRCSIWVGANNLTLTNVIVDQSNQYTSYPDLKYNRLDNAYACFLVYKNSTNVTFQGCEAWYADHHGFACFNYTTCSPMSLDKIRFLSCKAMHCGSGWEVDGGNPWARGFDVFESCGTLTNLEVNGCLAYDCLQSGYYNEGDYAPQHTPQIISGVYKNCHAENCGLRIANASINGTPLIVGLNGKKYGVPPDVYGEGFYVSGGISIINCTSKNNLRGFTVADAKISGFKDEGSYFGGSVAGGKVEGFVSKAAKIFAFVSYGTISGNVSVVDFNSSGRPPVIFNWFTLAAQMKIAPKSYKDMYTNDGAVLLTDGKLATTNCRFTRTCSAMTTGASPSLIIAVNSHSYDTFDKCVKGWYKSAASSKNVTVKLA